MILYTSEGNQVEIQHSIDIREALGTGLYFEEKQEEKKQKKVTKQKVEEVQKEAPRLAPEKVKDKPVFAEDKEASVDSGKLNRSSGSAPKFRSK